MKHINKEPKDIVVVSHFTHHYKIKENLNNGYIRSEIEGIRNILCRAFENLLRCTTHALSLSGQIENKYIVQDIEEKVENTALEEVYMPKCMIKVLERLKKENI